MSVMAQEQANRNCKESYKKNGNVEINKMNLVWLTDIHLNFLDIDARKKFYEKIMKLNFEAILISGDIAEATSISNLLKEMVLNIQKPIYFVLGNHDYYRGDINSVQNNIIKLTKSENLLHWLPASAPIKLTESTTLVGQDGWADGRFGDYHNSRVMLNDSRMITDLFQKSILGRNALLEKMRQLADDDAKKLSKNINQAINLYHSKKIIVLTHVPPFKEACQHMGKMSDNEWLPYFSSKATGDALMSNAVKNKSTEFLVLCGHTHSDALYQPLKNLIVKAGRSEYSEPVIQEMIYA